MKNCIPFKIQKFVVDTSIVCKSNVQIFETTILTYSDYAKFDLLKVTV